MSEWSKRAVSVIARSAAFSQFVSLLERLGGERPDLLRVLTYHRVDYPEAHPALDPYLISATPEAFDEQMSYLAAHCAVVSMPELLDACRNHTPLPQRAVMVTFDDAYSDFAERAWPILKHYQIPVTLFVPTAFPDHPEQAFWWDQLCQAVSETDRRDELATPFGKLPLATPQQRAQAFRQLREYPATLLHREALAWVERVCDELGLSHPAHPVLGWEALRQLAREGVTLGAHTRTHPLMHRISIEEARTEAVGSLRDLESEIGSVLPIFAYPGGGLSDQVVQMLEQAGFALAFTTARGINDLRAADRLRLRRINLGRRATLALMRAQLLPWLAHLPRFLDLRGRNKKRVTINHPLEAIDTQ